MSTELVTMGDLRAGDYIPGVEGKVMVSRVHEKHIPERMYRLTFDDKGVEKTIEASGNHLWYVETSVDRSLHRKRCREGKKIFRNLPDRIVIEMLKILEIDERTEIGLSDMVNLLEAHNNKPMIDHLVRIAESIGPVADETRQAEDLETGNIMKEQKLRLYDGHQFVRQVMSFTDRKYRKMYPIIVGRVVTTEEMLLIYETIEVHIPNPK